MPDSMKGNRALKRKPVVGIVMGSDSDLLIMNEASNFLKLMGIPHVVKVLSAHRTPDETFRFARESEKKGFKVLIAAAGGAAHLPGVLAGLSNLPVIGVPIKAKSLDGLDSLLSIAQMPSGIPVATMAINGAKNAAIFAARILATSDKNLQKALHDFREKMRQDVLEKNKSLKA